jgi:YD repeat-containing protein
MYFTPTPKLYTLATCATLLISPASAQQTTTYGPDGRVIERIDTDTGGSTTIYDASGRVSARCATSSTTITCYGADGRVISTTVRP